MAQHPNILKIFVAILNTVHSKNTDNNNNRNNYHPNNRFNSNNNNNNNKDKVLLTDVQTLTLKAGEMTKSRRSSPIKQIECVGGSARKEYELYPASIQCYNMGSNYDNNDVQWRCDANLDTSVKLGKIDVSCEGFSYPDDPYITAGSCGVFYELEYTDYSRRASNSSDETGWVSTAAWFLIICFILYIVVNHCGSPQSDHPELNNNNASDNNWPYGNDDPHGTNNNRYGGNSNTRYYPNLNNNNNGTAGCGINQNNNGGGPGWGTAAVAGLAGYFMGRGRSNRSYYSSPSYHSTYSSPSSYRSSSSGSRSSGISSSSSSHSGTSRR
ncbi:hypothetical protein DICPUDRAFT_160311 [Dictyostelium purpureum]|uniref:Store-operated calcium entry-associated regulatory factor n=1 Tax=Dictyostelium purpureum TaxID=5786 RepID=F1A646_DICPU|nr:uncharacterized protein DICPUDRAFT_160311 [Dictyostelium purpureum]EGC28333.1 hypothetical protein DICPUDRAFT_160311 [Dictyostelium purpureum]|eukprot:XP_003295138.1 hypothetical protein DICPUDRAFT_160311 [Dictyostelium purpureum]